MPKDEGLFKNPECFEALKKINQSPKDLNGQLLNQFRSLDQNQQGILRKDDFVNVLFEITKGTLQPSQVMSIVQQYTTSLDTAVNYLEFLQIIQKADIYGEGDYNQDGATPHLIDAMRGQIQDRISQLSIQDRDTIEKLRKYSRQANDEQGIDLSIIFNKLAQKGSDKISQDELLIAMSRVSDNIQMKDIKDLHRIIVGASPGQTAGIEDVKVSINEVVQMLTL